MATSISSLIAELSVLLQDPTFERWSQPEWLTFINRGQREVVSIKPNAYVKRSAVTLVAGSQQTIPSDGISFIRVDGNTNGRSVRMALQKTLDQIDPDWRQKRDRTVIHFCHSPYEQKAFEVYPASPGGNSVDVVYCAVPVDATLAGNLILDDIYAPAIFNYAAYLAWSKDAEYANNVEFAKMYHGLFMGQLMGKSNAEDVVNPNTHSKDDPNLN